MARRRKESDAEKVELVIAWLADKGVIACAIFRDAEGWHISGTNFPALPDVLRAIADKAEEQIGEVSVN